MKISGGSRKGGPGGKGRGGGGGSLRRPREVVEMKGSEGSGWKGGKRRMNHLKESSSEDFLFC